MLTWKVGGTQMELKEELKKALLELRKEEKENLIKL
jgi:hypothetical protein